MDNSNFDAEKPFTAAQASPCHQSAAPAGDESATPSHAQCVACQVCHSSACTPMVLAVALAPLAQERPHSGLRTWHSAELSASFKPPVS